MALAFLAECSYIPLVTNTQPKEMPMSFDSTATFAILAAGPALVTFEKADGTLRTMRATRCPALLPSGAVKGTDTRKDQGNLIAVFDLDARCWKGFFQHKMIAIQAIA